MRLSARMGDAELAGQSYLELPPAASSGGPVPLFAGPIIYTVEHLFVRSFARSFHPTQLFETHANFACIPMQLVATDTSPA